MKGVVFTEFMEMIEEKFGFDLNDEMIESSGVDGIYTQAGNYPAQDMFAMVEALSKLTNIPVEELILTYGKHLFSTLIKIYSKPISQYNDSFELISNVENVIHPEVKKLYPDSDLPHFEMISMNDHEMKILYKSSKPLMDLAKGLMLGCAEYYKDNVEISYEKPVCEKDIFKSLFTITKV